MQKAEKMQELRVFAQEIRLETLKTIGSLGFGHVPGSMSIIDALAVLYGDVMKIDPKNPRWEDRDWCVLSKGHAGPAMYATLGLKGYYPIEQAYTLNQPHTNFPSHTDRTKTWLLYTSTRWRSCPPGSRQRRCRSLQEVR